MALDTLPEFLTNFTPPVQAISQGAAAGARDYANALAAQELALKQEQMLRQEQARQAELQEQAQRFQLQQQAAVQRAGIDLGRLDVARAKQSQDSGMAARRFQATQDIQAAIAAGEDPVAAITRFLPGMSEGTPGVLGSFATGSNRNRITAEQNAAMLKQRPELEDIKLKGRKDIEDYKESLRKLRVGEEKNIGKNDFINRHFNEAIRQMFAEGEGKDATDRAQKASKMLSDVWASNKAAEKQQNPGWPEVGTVRDGYSFNGQFAPSDKRAWDAVTEE